MVAIKSEYNEKKFTRWKVAVWYGVEKVIDSIEQSAKKFLKQRKTKDEELTFEKVEKSWYHSDPDFSQHSFGFDHSEAVDIERGKVEIVTDKSPDGSVGQSLKETSPRPFMKLSIQDHVGNKTKEIITKTVEESGLNERI